MLLKINNTEISVYPKEFTVTPLDIDNGESTVRTADGTLNRDRVAVKRQIEMSWGVLSWEDVSSILQAMQDVFFDFYYPDPMTGQYETKTFYVGNRPTPAALSKNGQILWSGLKVTLTEK
ncbi:DUF6711 family protein [Petroclostridium sp. X23]|uniref:DUF6711 family protein n=1 Tax=Petroclostridium sp. X23 TaxID=3045146 RepID=UPI0024AD55CE|nr:DUF6711 family protein [Petroclostridium sp. X23]WHH58489.1 hypothetical protein QKW49_22250 [Petroclostridium sp. X23]